MHFPQRNARTTLPTGEAGFGHRSLEPSARAAAPSIPPCGARLWRRGMTAPWDCPSQLREQLNLLEAQWREDQDPLHAWNALDLCGSWTDAEGKLIGPYHPPLWCQPFRLAKVITEAAASNSPPRVKELESRIMSAAGLNLGRRNTLKDRHNEMLCMLEAGMFTVYRAAGSSPAWIYSALYGEVGTAPSDSPERRNLQKRVQRGKSLLKRLRTDDA